MNSENQNISQEGDVVLVYYQDEPTLYARIEAIRRDVKKDWYRVHLLLLTLPAQPVTWILRDEYIQGAPFTMGGQPMRLEKVSPQIIDERADEDIVEKSKKSPPNSAKVIPFKK